MLRKNSFFICLIFFSVVMNSATHAELSRVHTDILIPVEQSLLEGFQSQIGKKAMREKPKALFAYKVVIGDYKGCTAHIAYYSDATIITFLHDPEGHFSEGSQIVTIGTTPVSISTKWKTETINNVQYIKHFHDRCEVYSTDLSQFVIFKS